MTLQYGDLVLVNARIKETVGPILTVIIETDDEVANIPVRVHAGNMYGVNLDEPELISLQGNIELIQEDGTAIIKIGQNPMSSGARVPSDPTHVALKTEDIQLLVPSLRNEDGSYRSDV